MEDRVTESRTRQRIEEEEKKMTRNEGRGEERDKEGRKENGI
jgi:hypothetical protein